MSSSKHLKTVMPLSEIIHLLDMLKYVRCHLGIKKSTFWQPKEDNIQQVLLLMLKHRVMERTKKRMKKKKK